MQCHDTCHEISRFQLPRCMAMQPGSRARGQAQGSIDQLEPEYNCTYRARPHYGFIGSLRHGFLPCTRPKVQSETRYAVCMCSASGDSENPMSARGRRGRGLMRCRTTRRVLVNRADWTSIDGAAIARPSRHPPCTGRRADANDE